MPRPSFPLSAGRARVERVERFCTVSVLRWPLLLAPDGLPKVGCHLTRHMKDGGVPMIFDTGTNETGHKPTKTAATLTQKNFDTFDQQTNEHLLETHLLSLAMEEIAGRPLWKYSEGYDHMPVVNRRNDGNTTTGAKLTCDFGEPGEEKTLQMARKTAGGDVFVEGCLVDFIADLQETLGDYAKNFGVRTEHTRDGQKFRGHMKYRGGVRQDWVEVDWGDDGYLPCKIWGFADLTGLPANSGISFAGVSYIYPSVYAIVECGYYPTQVLAIASCRHGWSTRANSRA